MSSTVKTAERIGLMSMVRTFGSVTQLVTFKANLEALELDSEWEREINSVHCFRSLIRTQINCDNLLARGLIGRYTVLHNATKKLKSPSALNDFLSAIQNLDTKTFIGVLDYMPERCKRDKNLTKHLSDLLMRCNPKKKGEFNYVPLPILKQALEDYGVKAALLLIENLRPNWKKDRSVCVAIGSEIVNVINRNAESADSKVARDWILTSGREELINALKVEQTVTSEEELKRDISSVLNLLFT